MVERQKFLKPVLDIRTAALAPAVGIFSFCFESYDAASITQLINSTWYSNVYCCDSES